MPARILLGPQSPASNLRRAADAIRAGAFGVSTSRTISHKSHSGDYTPTLKANEDELTGIALGLKDAGAGFIGTFIVNLDAAYLGCDFRGINHDLIPHSDLA